MIRKKLSIIIPYHNEDDSCMENLLGSINNQINIDFNDLEIIVSNNSNDPVYPLILDKFPKLNISYLICPIKNNVGSSRQCAIDHSIGKWLLICDSDDSLYSANTLSTIFKDIDKYDTTMDILYYKEQFEQIPNQFRECVKNLVLVHDKLFRADYLKLNNIRFSDHLNYGADVYFNVISNGSFPRHIYLDTYIYIWRFNKKSVSHSEDFNIIDDIDSVKRTYMAYKKIKQYYSPEIAKYAKLDIFKVMLHCYEVVQLLFSKQMIQEAKTCEKILIAFIEEIDPELTCLECADEQAINLIEFKEFVSNYKKVYPKVDIELLERTELCN